MTPPDSVIQTPRDFAINVLLKLREAGFEALWAGGCVRDDLLGLTPKDYDVATTATPQQVIELFGKRRTVPVGVSFGVVMVLGPNRACGQIEVATFRTDGEYFDGRRPATVHYCSAEEDAKRRDLTINGIFYDPIAEVVIDYVGGQQDLAARIVRAIGHAQDRFTEDKLRMLRAVRFAATYNFGMEQSTAAAIRELRHEIRQVSAERIGQEVKRMLSHRTRAVSLQMLVDFGLLEGVFSGIFHPSALPQFPADYFTGICRILSHLQIPTFEPALAVLFSSLFCADAVRRQDRTSGIRSECRKLRLSNDESDAICWILESAHSCENAEQQPLHVIKPILADQRWPLLLDYLQAVPAALEQEAIHADFLQDYLSRTPDDQLNPPPLATGRDLKTLGIEPGPAFKRFLTQIREEQLDERLANRDEALNRLRTLVREFP